MGFNATTTTKTKLNEKKTKLSKFHGYLNALPLLASYNFYSAFASNTFSKLANAFYVLKPGM